MTPRFLRSPWLLVAIGLVACALVAVRVFVNPFGGEPTREQGDPRPFGTIDDIEHFSQRDDTNVLFILIDTLRAHERGVAEAAAERVQLALVFPTTLLTLPAFVLPLVPPLVWTAFAG